MALGPHPWIVTQNYIQLYVPTKNFGQGGSSVPPHLFSHTDRSQSSAERMHRYARATKSSVVLRFKHQVGGIRGGWGSEVTGLVEPRSDGN